MKKKPPIEHALISAALAALLGKAKAKDTLKPGTRGFVGTATFRLDVVIDKGEAQEYVPTTSLPLKSVLAICLARAGVDKDAIVELILEAAQQAMDPDHYADQVADYIEATDAALEAVEGMLAKLPPKTREGKCCVTGSAVLIDFEASEA